MKKIYSFLSLCLLFLGLTTATAQTAELKLTFDRTGDNVSVSVAGLDGVTASVVSKSHDWKDLGVANANTVLCPNVNGNTDPTITWGIQLNGVPANYKLKGMALDIHALNGAGQYQDPADNVNRHWNVAVAQGETPVANFADIEISQGTEEGRTMGNNHKVHSVAAAEALAATDPMTLNFTVTKGSENKGCFFGLSEVTLTYEVEEVVEPEPEVPATPLEFVKANPVLESEVTSLSSITLTFNKEIASVSAEPGMFWFIDSDMNMYDAEVQINATDAKTLTITLAEEIKEAGTYIAMFSQGALVAADGTSNETVVELAWTVKPEVVEPEVPTTPEGRTVYFYHPEYVGFLTMAADGSECSLVKDFSVENLSAYEWVLEPAAGENQYYVLNKATGFYLGQCLTSTTVTGVNAAAKQAYELSKNGIYDVLKDVTGSTYNYLHVAGHNVVVGWEASAAASHWCLLGSVEEYNNVVNNLKFVDSLNEALTKAEQLKEKSQPYFKALITEASQFSSNNKEATEGTYEGLLDGDNTTFFHSNWHGGGPEPHDLQVVLKNNEETNFLVKYESRNSSGYRNDRPVKMSIYGGTVGEDGTVTFEAEAFANLTTTDGIGEVAGEFKFTADKVYDAFRFEVHETVMTDGTKGNVWFTYGEFQMYSQNMTPAEVELTSEQAAALDLAITNAKNANVVTDNYSVLIEALNKAVDIQTPEVPVEPTELELVKANPALESEVTSLSSITLTFNKEIASVTINESTFFFMSADFQPVFGVQAQVNATDAKSITLTLPEEIKAEGEYVAMFMPSAIVAADGTSNQGIIELAWTVKAAPAVEPLKFVSIDPAAGSKLSSVAKFTLTFNKPVTLKNEEGATLHANGGSTTLQVLVSETDAKEVVLAADKEITNSGSYELKLAAGTLEDADGGLNEALTFNYEVESANNTLNVVKTDPDVNVPQESLKRVVLTFETEVYDYDSHATVNVTDESGAVVATGMMELDDYVWENVIISFNKEITTPGKYTVTVPENTIFGYGTYNPEINLTYTIGAEPTTGATLEPVSVDPAEPYWWDAMEDIEYIAINFPEEITYNAEKPVTVTFNAVENVEVSVAVSADDAKQLVVTFPENLKIGEYVVNVPEGAVVAVSGATYNPSLTYTYNVDYAYNTFEPTSITPAAGKVESLKEIVLDFGPNDYPGTNGLDKEATFELTNAVGEVVATGQLSYFGRTGAAVTLDKEITELGLYTITIPEGVIWNSKVEGTSDRGVHKGARCNPTIELVYSIGEAATVTEVTPVPGHYEEIPSEISVTFSKEIGSVVYLILRNENTGMRGYYFAEDEYTVDGSKLSFTLPADMIKYAAGATVQMQVLDKDGFPVTYAASEDEMVEGFVMLEYTATAKSDLFVAKSVDPAEGEVEELSVLKVTFENLKATEGMSYVGGFDETKVVEVLDAEGNQVATAAMEVVNTVYREEWEGEVYEYESPSLVAQFTLNNTITEPGTYTFVIPEATVYNEGFYPEAEDLGVDWGAIYNPEVRYTYTIAGEAEVSYEPLHNGTKERTDRNITAVKLSSVLGDNEYSLTATEQSQDFVDATAVATFKVVAGEELTAEVKHAGEWVHHVVYVDLDANGFNASIEEGSEWKPAGDLMAYAFYNNGGSSDEYGYNSVGTSLAGQDRHMPAIPAFKAPEQPGTYRMRFVQTWCSIDPAGDNDGKFGDFKSNGDQIVDVILEVTDATGIGAISVDGNNDVYSLDGRKVNVKMGKKLNKGIYIVNGKKVYVK